MTQKKYKSDDNIQYTGYGIYNKQYNIQVDDITTQRRELEKLIVKLNREHLSPVHIYDVIDDFLVCLSCN